MAETVETSRAANIPDPHPWDTDIQYLFRGHTIWHYTAQAGLDGILRSQTLWASSAAMLSDSAEMAYGIEVAEETLNAWWENHPIVDAEHKFLRKSMDVASQMIRADQVMVACASSEEDDPFQWRFYADDGRGYAIGLRAAWIGGMLDNSDPPRVQMVPGHRSWGRVVYGRDDQHRLVEHQIAFALQRFRDAEDEREREWMVGGMAQMLSDLIAHMKDESFRDENEFRLVQTVSNASHARFVEWMNEEGFTFDRDVPPVNPEAATCLRERQTASRPIPYLALTRFPDQPRDAEGEPEESWEVIDAALQRTHLPITCIRVGHRLDQDAACREVKDTLRELGYEDAQVKVGHYAPDRWA